MVKRFIAVALGALAVVLAVAVVVLPRSASADLAPGDAVWKTKAGSSIMNENQVLLNGGNTSVESEDLGITLAGETKVSFVYSLDAGAKCVGGAPRVFLQVGGTYVNSWDQLIGAGTQCGDPVDGDPQNGKVTFVVPAGKVTHAGVVYDNGQPGTVIVSELVIGEGLVNFKERVPAPTPTTPEPTPSSPTPSPSTGEPSPSSPVDPTPSSSATKKPSPSPTFSRSGSPTPTAEPTISTSPASGVGGGSNGGLPLTGGKPLAVGGLGAIVVIVGAALFVLARRRRDEGESGPETA